ncbi:hypothetical protein [Pseudonocardia alni]|uniref:hypothetical protein n=1 Tax=Pseudonocardia alni TaxID=33907 RepID=UPI0027A86876|nr:hypothetical protein PaSha_12870 [Pseudonocardia alni]
MTLIAPDGMVVVLPSTAPIPRCAVDRIDDGLVDTAVGQVQFTLTRPQPKVDGLPAATTSVLLIVSREVARACPDRTDLVFPDLLERDDAGAVVGCAALGRVDAG